MSAFDWPLFLVCEAERDDLQMMNGNNDESAAAANNAGVAAVAALAAAASASAPVATFETVLQCQRCSAAFELALRVPPVPSDQAIEAICANCNMANGRANEASFRHLHKSWVCVTATAMYNLRRASGNRVTHFRISQDIVPYVLLHWNELCVGRTLHRTLANTISSAITTSLYAFTPKHGTGSGVWGLRDNGELAFARRARGPKFRHSSTASSAATTPSPPASSVSPPVLARSARAAPLPAMLNAIPRLSLSANHAMTKRRRSTETDEAADSLRSVSDSFSSSAAVDIDIDIDQSPASAIRCVIRIPSAPNTPPHPLGSIDLALFTTVGALRFELQSRFGDCSLLKVNAEFPSGVPIWSAQNQQPTLKFWRDAGDAVGLAERPTAATASATAASTAIAMVT